MLWCGCSVCWWYAAREARWDAQIYLTCLSLQIPCFPLPEEWDHPAINHGVRAGGPHTEGNAQSASTRVGGGLVSWAWGFGLGLGALGAGVRELPNRA